jgi:hypothetical protein
VTTPAPEAITMVALVEAKVTDITHEFCGVAKKNAHVVMPLSAIETVDEPDAITAEPYATLCEVAAY